MRKNPYPFRSLSAAFVLAVVALLCAPSHSAAQTSQSRPAASQTAGSPQAPDLNNPLQPEKQPDLAVDRDPIPSPDIVVYTPETAKNGKAAPGEVTKDKNGMYRITEDVDEVLLNCAVVDEKGDPIYDLKQNAFRIWEDGVPQVANSFTHQDVPVSMGILIDNSGSMRDKRTAVNAAAMKLLEESNTRDAAFVVNFNEHAFLDQNFTVDRVAIHRGLSHFDSRGATALYDAVAASADQLAHHAPQPRQVLLIITDGADNASRLRLQDSIRRVQSLGGPVVYTIGLLYDADQKEYQKAHDDLEMLSSETGGIAYFPKSIDDVDRIASDVARDIRNQYIVGYHSTKAANLGGYRTIHVEAVAPGHKRLIVRTRRGYYAQTGQRRDMERNTGAPAGTQSGNQNQPGQAQNSGAQAGEPSRQAQINQPASQSQR
jgi:VWFA-related protein